METKVNDKKFYIIMAITLLIMLGFGKLPTFGQVTPAGMQILGIFLGCIFAWCCGELVWSSILGLVLLGVFNFGTMASNFAGAYGHNTVAMLFVTTVFCYSIQKHGALAEISKWLVGMKWAQRGPWFLVLSYFVAAALASMVMANCVPVVILLWTLFYEMAKEVGIKPYDPFAAIVLCGIWVCGYVGTSVVPYNGMTLLVKGAAESVNPDFVFNIGQYMLLNLITMIVFVPLLVLVLRLFLGSKVKLNIPEREPYKMQLNFESKIALFTLLCTVICLIVPNFLAADNPIKIFFTKKLTTVGIFMLASAILMLVRVKGKPVLDIVEALQTVPWPMFLLVASALCISGYITGSGMGVVETITAFLGPILQGISPLGVTLFFVAFGLIMTNFINDAVTCVVLFPIASTFIISAGGSEMLLAILFAQVTVQGCLMPSGSIAGAMLHGNAEWMKAKDVIFYVAIMEILLMFVLLVVALFGQMIGV